MKRTKLTVLLILIFSFSFLISCSPEPENSDLAVLEIAVDDWPGFYPVVLAQEMGYFEEEGILVNYHFSDNARQQRLEFESGEYDGITLSLGSLISIKEVDTQVKVVLLTDMSTTGDAVVVSPEIQSVEDLKGKRIIASTTGYGEIVVQAMLDQAGLKSNDIIWVPLEEPETALSLLLEGKVQGFQTWEPWVSRAIEGGAYPIFTGEDIPGLILDAVGFHGEVIDERPADVQAFVNGWFKAVDFWLENPDEAAEIISEALEIESSIVSLSGFQLLTLSKNQTYFYQGVDYSSAYYTAQVYIEFFYNNGELTDLISPEEVLDSQFVLNK